MDQKIYDDGLLHVNLIQPTECICMCSFIMMFISKGVQKAILQIVHHLLLYVYIALWYKFNDSTLLMKFKILIAVIAITT
jgi:hypothetical protein